MDRFEAMKTFVRVVEAGNFSQVARELNIGQPAVSKQVGWLEAHLGAQLLHRTSRSIRLTGAGQTFYEAATRTLAELDAAERSVGRGELRPSGLLRVSLSAGFGRLHLVPILPAFYERYPDVAVDIVVSDRFVDLIEDGIDVAIRIANLADSALIARRIGTSPRITVASRGYLERAGEPICPADLDRHQRVAFTFLSQPNAWTFQGVEGRMQHMPVGPVRANDAETIRAAVLAGLGVAQAPRWLFSAELATGDVREVLTGYPPERTPIHAVFPAGRRPQSKVRAFVDFVAAAFASDPCLGDN